jgi:hypothetical protein
MAKDETVYRTAVRFNSIYVVESLPEGDLRTGREIFEQILMPAEFKIDGLVVEHTFVETKEEFVRCLRRIADAAAVANRLPIVHLETHGTRDGISLASGERLAWAELVPHLTPINVNCGNNLIVVAVSCYGWNLTASLLPSDRAPVFMLVGPTDAMAAGELLKATRLFYTALVGDMDVNSALESANPGLDFKDWLLQPATAEVLYCRVFRQYIDDYGGPEKIESRAQRLVEDIRRSRELDSVSAVALLITARRDLRDFPATYERHRQRFLMLDLFPQDQDRMGLTYEKCLGNRAAS